MGVLSCSRNGCENIMCDTYVNGIGYICDECQNEFKRHLFENAIFDLTNSEYKKELEKFMETPKSSHQKEKPIDVDDFFKQYKID